MRIIEIIAQENGSHRNQECSNFMVIPEGWAIIPNNIEIPSTFPFVHIIVENADGVPTVLEMESGIVPDDDPQTEDRKTAEQRVSDLEEALNMILEGVIE
jgi:hypothetical protein